MDKQPDEKIKLLLVEDDEDFYSALMPRLAKRNFEVNVAVSAEKALDRFNNSEFDIVVADIKLPGMDGIKFLSEIRKLDKDIPVILITGYANLESAKEAVRLKASDYLLKPLEDINELLNPVDKAVYNYKLLRENKRLDESLQKTVVELRESERKLKDQKNSLEQKNAALREILEQIEIEKKQIKSDILANVEKLLLPALEKLRGKAASVDAKYIDILQRNLEELASSFGRKIAEKAIKLTPKEIEICNMIKSGLTSKEISKLLNISRQTTERHRNNIRKKLGIVKKDVNLVTYLQML
jgi:DNA-binding NarL/FixJ family response regulator